MQEQQSAGRGRPVIFGEVLFDCFADGHSVLGGAPFNVAWHLRGFGLDPLFISRVGADHQGDRAQEAMHRWGLDLAGIQIDSSHPTGTVQVALRGDQHTFAILPAQAYDFIDKQAALTAARKAEPILLYHGTLAARQAPSADTLTELRQALEAPIFVDINLRAPWWQTPAVITALTRTRFAKLNDEELAELAGATLDEVSLPLAAEELRRRLAIDTLIVTMGAAGALLLNDEGNWRDLPPQVSNLMDTVGAGDAFSAVAIIGLLRGWPPPLILQRAMAFAAAICGVRGATVFERDFYHRQLETWET